MITTSHTTQEEEPPKIARRVGTATATQRRMVMQWRYRYGSGSR